MAAHGSRFAPADIRADVRAARERARARSRKLVDAARLMDSLFLGRSGRATRDAQELSHDGARRRAATPRAAMPARLHYFLINKGPWSRLDHNQAFVAGAPAKPEAANFYPADATKAKSTMDRLARAATRRRAATGFFTTIRRGTDGGFDGRALQRRVSGRARRAPPRCCARPPR